MIEWSLFKYHILILYDWDSFQDAMFIMRQAGKSENQMSASGCTRR